MRRSEKEIINQSEIDKILSEESICRVAMVDNGIPYVIPMNFGYENGVLYFHSAKEGRKLDVVKQNPNVCIEVERGCEIVKNEKPCNWGMKFMSIIAEGKVIFLQNNEEKIHALNVVMQKYSGRNDYEFENKSLNAVEVWSVKIQKVTGKKSGY